MDLLELELAKLAEREELKWSESRGGGVSDFRTTFFLNFYSLLSPLRARKYNRIT